MTYGQHSLSFVFVKLALNTCCREHIQLRQECTVKSLERAQQRQKAYADKDEETSPELNSSRLEH